ncbi:MAG: GNAT family N-acetyltransferase [Pseudobdellovibrionaceae bacterium]
MSSDILSGANDEIHVRLAKTPEEIDAAQYLRYRVFYDECKAIPSEETNKAKRDRDEFDAYAEHLIVVDPSRGRRATDYIIGTYRLITQKAASKLGHFYSSGEYDIAPMINTNVPLLELGRSCVEEEYRTRPVLQLLWQGIAHYVFENDVGLTFGCASLHGTDVEKLALELSYLHHFHSCTPELRPRALESRYVDMNLLPVSAIDEAEAFHRLPPLLKGYLRIGAKIGDGAVIDHQFNTTDVCVVLPTSYVKAKYLRHYERSTNKRVSPDILTAIPPLTEDNVTMANAG